MHAPIQGQPTEAGLQRARQYGELVAEQNLPEAEVSIAIYTCTCILLAWVRRWGLLRLALVVCGG